MKKSSLLFCLLIIFNIPNALSLELREYCFNRSISLDRVKIYLKQITLDRDIINLNNATSCIEIGVDESRVELFQKYLSMNYQFKQSHSSQNEKKECIFEIEKTNKIQNSSSKSIIGNETDFKNITKTSSGKSSSIVRVMESKVASLSVDGSVASISCNIRGRVTDVDINLMNSDSSLATTIQMIKGQRVNLLRIVKDLKDKSSSLSISRGAKSYKSTLSKQSNIYLILK